MRPRTSLVCAHILRARFELTLGNFLTPTGGRDGGHNGAESVPRTSGVPKRKRLRAVPESEWRRRRRWSSEGVGPEDGRGGRGRGVLGQMGG